MAYLSKENIIAAYNQLSLLTNDPSAQGATQVTSSLRYLFALAQFFTHFQKNCNTRSRSDKDKFIEYVGEVVAINDNYYTANFFNALKEDADYKVGSNFFSVNVVKTSIENSGKDYVFPKRGNSPLFLVRNGELIIKEEYFDNIGSILSNSELRSAFAIWLVRNDNLNTSDVYASIKQILSDRYSGLLVDKFLPPRNSFVSFESWSFEDNPAKLDISDFPKPSNKESHTFNGVLSSDELIQKVRNSFLRYWRIIDQHGAQFELYVNKFESAVNPILHNLELGLSDVFAIVDFEQYNAILNRIIATEPSLSYLNDEKGPDGARYYIWSTNRHLRNYLEIISISDFFGNVRQQHNRVLSIASATSDFNKDYLRAMRTKPFLLLAGISGTGKSRIVKQMAFDSCPDNVLLRSDLTSPGNYCLIEVKPNWHDSTELLGYESQIGKPHYQHTPFVKFLAKAMLYPDVPFFVCLDEMNLAPVEQYFAEFLSVLESRTKIDGHIVSEPLIKADIFANKDYELKLQDDLFGLEIKEETTADGLQRLISGKLPEEAQTVYDILKQQGLRIPENVIVVGTVNMDETTHQFSRKVIDRAMTIEMNLPEGDPFMDFFANGSELAYRANPTSPSLYLATETKASAVVTALAADNAGKTEWLKGKVAAFLGNLNGALEGTPFKVAYRVQNELMLYFYQLWLEDKTSHWRDILNTACDQILMMKVLPRIEGDGELLETPLDELARFCEPYTNASKKIAEMQSRLEKSQFTSFWP